MPNDTTNNLGTIRLPLGSVQRVPVDFGDSPQLIAGASGGAPNPLVLSVTIETFSVTCTGAGAPTVSSTRLDFPYQVSALFNATVATAGTYPATYSITLSDADGTTIIRTGNIQVTP